VEKLTKWGIRVGKVVVSQFISLDGVVEDPGGGEDFERGGWAFKFDRGPECDKFKLDEVMASEALLLGRVTYEGFAQARPSRSGDFADKFRGVPKYFVSTTLENPEWNNSTVIDGDVAEAVAELKQDVDGVYPRQRQRPARADADGARTRRRVPAEDLPYDPRSRQALLWRNQRRGRAAARGCEAGRRVLHLHVRAKRKGCRECLRTAKS
jgi:dihydrofolate reductase